MNAVDQHVLTERRDSVFWITFNRPEARNAMTFAMYDRLGEILADVAGDTTLRCVVLTGAGDKAFVAGTDIAQFEAFATADDALAYEARMDALIGRLETLPLPTVAAIRGACTGGGLAIATACDLRIAAPGARFGFPMARTLGNCLSSANLARFTRLVGIAAAKDVLFTARLLDARRMYDLGFLREVTEDDAALLPRATELAETIAANAPLTIRASKEALARIATGKPHDDDHEWLLRCYLSEDFREGMRAFFEKRPAEWKGR